jgi:hypothetical protein
VLHWEYVQRILFYGDPAILASKCSWYNLNSFRNICDRQTPTIRFLKSRYYKLRRSVRTKRYFVRFQVLTAASMMFRIVFWDVLPYWWWRQYAPLKRRSTIILHGSTSQKTILNIKRYFIRKLNIHDLHLLASFRFIAFYQRISHIKSVAVL